MERRYTINSDSFSNADLSTIATRNETRVLSESSLFPLPLSQQLRQEDDTQRERSLGLMI